MTTFTVVSLAAPVAFDTLGFPTAMDYREIVIRSRGSLHGLLPNGTAFSRWFTAQQRARKATAYYITEISEYPDRHTFDHCRGF